MTRRVSSFCPRGQAFALESEQKHFDIRRNRFLPGFSHRHFVNWVPSGQKSALLGSLASCFAGHQGPVLWNRRLTRYHKLGPFSSALPQTTHARFPCTWLSRSTSALLRLEVWLVQHKCISHASQSTSVNPPALGHVLDLLQRGLLRQFRTHEARAL